MDALFSGCDECADVDSDQDSEAPFHECAGEKRQCSAICAREGDLYGRTPEESLKEFFVRLEQGWIRFGSRFFIACRMFKSTSTEH